MTRHRLLVIAGAAAFLLALVARLPATVALAWAPNASFQPSGVTGTLWRGGFAAAGAGALRLGPTTWRLSVPALFLGRLQGTVETQVGSGTASGVVALGIGGTVSCRDCRYAGPAASLRSLIPMLATVDGRLDLSLAELAVRDRWPVRVTGAATVTGVALAVPGAPLTPATPRANFTARVDADPVGDDGIIVAEIADDGGPLQLQASLTLTPPGSFEVSGRALARPEAPPTLAAALGMLGRPGPDGAIDISFAGSF